MSSLDDDVVYVGGQRSPVNELDGLDINEVSLVGMGDNPPARVLLVKNDPRRNPDPQGAGLTMPDMQITNPTAPSGGAGTSPVAGVGPDVLPEEVIKYVQELEAYADSLEDEVAKGKGATLAPPRDVKGLVPDDEEADPPDGKVIGAKRMRRATTRKAAPRRAVRKAPVLDDEEYDLDEFEDEFDDQADEFEDEVDEGVEDAYEDGYEDDADSFDEEDVQELGKVLKSNPALAKLLGAQQARIEKLQSAAQEAADIAAQEQELRLRGDIAKRAEALKDLGEDREELSKTLFDLFANVEPELYERVEKLLVRSANRIAKAGVFDEVGKSAQDGKLAARPSALDKLSERLGIVDKVAKDGAGDGGMTAEQAVVAALQAGGGTAYDELMYEQYGYSTNGRGI